LSDFFSGLQTLLALIALILSIAVTYIVVRQTKQLHEKGHVLAVEDFQRVRFESLFCAVEKVLSSIADLKADLLPYWKETRESLETKTNSGAMLDREIDVHRAIEHLSAHRKSLEIALAGLPTSGLVGHGDESLEEAREQFELAAAWLGGCVMTTYSALVARNEESEVSDSELKTDGLIFSRIQNEWDAHDSYSKAKRDNYSRGIRNAWTSAREEETKNRDVIDAKSRAVSGPLVDPNSYVPEGAAQIAFHFLENAEAEFVRLATDLSFKYTSARMAAMKG
jgi:hypothetical protein